MTLDSAPAATTVSSYVLTRGSRRAWETINGHLAAGRGGLFWIAGAAGAGKTHFLNYVLALSARAGSLTAETARYLNLPLAIDGELSRAEIERRLLALIVTALAGKNQTSGLLRQMRGADALPVALESAYRQGVKGITIALDLGLCHSAELVQLLMMLAQVTHACKNLRFIILAAGRGAPPPAALPFDVTPQAGEAIPVAVGRARRLDESALPKVEGLYRDLDDNSWDTRAIYPLHPIAAATLQSLRAPDEGVATLAAAVREVIESWYADRDFERLIVPAALMRSAVVRRAVNARLGEAGRAALKIATAAAAAIASKEAARQLANPLVDTIVLNHLTAPVAALPLDQLRARLGFADDTSVAAPGLTESLAVLAARSHGVIVFDAETRTVGFNPRGAGAPELAAFNAALALARCFDSTLDAAHDLPELTITLSRLDAAMALALEDACRNRDTLDAAMAASGARLLLAQQRAFSDFIDLAEAGPQALIATGADQTSRDAALITIAAYDALALLAAAVPRLHLMRDYLNATGLLSLHDEAHRDSPLAPLATKCQVLAPSLHPAALLNGGRKLEDIEAVFQECKWVYVQHYRAAHEQRRLELHQLAPLADNARRHLEALRHLNAIAALGAAAGADLAREFAALEFQFAPCDQAAALAPEIAPTCPRCAFRLGAASPLGLLNDLFERARRALELKLTALSQRAIARLIRQHDRDRRLEGFLKIIQAAQTDALVRVLDDQLAGYLGRLLDEHRDSDSSEASDHAVARDRPPQSAQSARRGKRI
jgi:hypothetical protein